MHRSHPSLYSMDQLHIERRRTHFMSGHSAYGNSETYEMPENTRPELLLQSKVCHIKSTRRRREQKKKDERKRKIRIERRVNEMRKTNPLTSVLRQRSVHRQACDMWCGNEFFRYDYSSLFFFSLFLACIAPSTATMNTGDRLSGNASYLFKVYSKLNETK